jgi:hypothetical protein
LSVSMIEPGLNGAADDPSRARLPPESAFAGFRFPPEVIVIAVHDLTAARSHGIVDALTRAAVATFADKGYRGARGAVGVPFYGRHLPTRMREVNSAYAKIRSIWERAIATLKTWKVLAKLHCRPQRAIPLLAAILLLQLIEEQRETR